MNIFVVIPFLAGYILIGLSQGVSHASAGFIELSASSMELTQKKYSNDSREVYLVAMMHIGERNFYEKLAASFPAESSIVLMEGVTDRKKLLKYHLNYQKFADFLGIDTQSDYFNPASREIECKYADLDMSDLSPGTVKFINKCARIHSQGFTSQESLKEMFSQGADDKEFELFKTDIVGKRNIHLLEQIAAGLKTHRIVVVPWGAYHMPGLESALLCQGFIQSDLKKWDVVKYQTIFHSLVYKWQSKNAPSLNETETSK
ncbi:MAG: hypothetical protein PHW04_11505 [Candidatus Wallbacteria bacterium]|nr:hypothetical protein [Candidatus Wallbacteria bacterium]